MNILIIEDNHSLARSIEKSFLSANFANIINILHSYNDFLYHSDIQYYDMILLDISLGGSANRDGIKILQSIRKNNNKTPIIIMSSYHECDSLRESFLSGANDYIIKPFRNKELQIRIERWFYNYLFLEYFSKEVSISYKDLVYCLKQKKFSYENVNLTLSKGSKHLLLLFLIHKESVLSTEYLIGKIWGNIENDGVNLRIKILRLKKQLEGFGCSHWIQTIRGEGYMLIDKKLD